MGWILVLSVLLGMVVLAWLVNRRYRNDPNAVARLKREEYTALVRHIWHQ